MNKYSEINKLDDGLNACKMKFSTKKRPRTSFFNGFKKLTGSLPQYLRATRMRFASLLAQTMTTATPRTMHMPSEKMNFYFPKFFAITQLHSV